MRRYRSSLTVALLACIAGHADANERIRLRLDASAAEAVLGILDELAAGEDPPSGLWDRLRATEPYRRLHERERSMGRAFTDAEFRAFVEGSELRERREALRSTLERWSAADLESAADGVLGYLPDEARIHATVYPMIKPRPNSFVYALDSNPAIFLYLDPEVDAAEFTNTVAHELHHVGFASVESADASAAPPAVRTALEWMGALGEGFAMLAAAGGPDVHPHASSPSADRERWDRDVARFATDLAALDAFFRDIVSGRLGDEAAVRAAGMRFFGEQGAWYTVGWKMAVTIERRRGRDYLVGCMRDPRRLMTTWNAIAATDTALPEWSAELVAALSSREATE